MILCILQSSADKMPAFEALCLCLAETSPSARPHFVRAASTLVVAPASGQELPGKPAPVMCAMPRTTRLRLYAPSTFITAFV